MGLGIAYVAAKVRRQRLCAFMQMRQLTTTHQDAKVEVVLSDASEAALNKGLAFMGRSGDFVEQLSLA